MARKVVRTLEAGRDLAEIARYTREVWGPAMVRIYLGRIEARIVMLRRDPFAVSQDRGSVRTGLRSITAGRHYVFFTVDGDTIVLLRVIHQSRDWVRQIGPES